LTNKINLTEKELKRLLIFINFYFFPHFIIHYDINNILLTRIKKEELLLWIKKLKKLLLICYLYEDSMPNLENNFQHINKEPNDELTFENTSILFRLFNNFFLKTSNNCDLNTFLNFYNNSENYPITTFEEYINPKELIKIKILLIVFIDFLEKTLENKNTFYKKYKNDPLLSFQNITINQPPEYLYIQSKSISIDDNTIKSIITNYINTLEKNPSSLFINNTLLSPLFIHPSRIFGYVVRNLSEEMIEEISKIRSIRELFIDQYPDLLSKITIIIQSKSSYKKISFLSKMIHYSILEKEELTEEQTCFIVDTILHNTEDSFKIFHKALLESYEIISIWLKKYLKINNIFSINKLCINNDYLKKYCIKHIIKKKENNEDSDMEKFLLLLINKYSESESFEKNLIEKEEKTIYYNFINNCSFNQNIIITFNQLTLMEKHYYVVINLLLLKELESNDLPYHIFEKKFLFLIKFFLSYDSLKVDYERKYLNIFKNIALKNKRSIEKENTISQLLNLIHNSNIKYDRDRIFKISSIFTDDNR
jgi:hypothetical protein